MTSLTDIASFLRKTILIGSILSVVIIVVTLATMSYVRTLNSNVPIPTPTPSTSFGTLPPVAFPDSAVRPSSLDLQLIEGSPPEATSGAAVYLVPDRKPSLFSKRQGVTFGKKLGFLEEPVELSETDLQFNDPATKSQLTLNIATNNFFMRRGQSDVTIFQNLTITDPQAAGGLAREFFSDLLINVDTLSETKISYYSYDGVTPSKLPDQRGAQLVRVDFFQPQFGPYPVVTNAFYTSGVYLLFSATRRDIQTVIEASYQFFPADPFISATYPTISGQDAWETLEGGGGYIASSAPSGSAIVRRVYLAHYEPHVYLPFLQPVWVFTGDDGFAAYVPAIKDEWVGE